MPGCREHLGTAEAHPGRVCGPGGARTAASLPLVLPGASPCVTACGWESILVRSCRPGLRAQGSRHKVIAWLVLKFKYVARTWVHMKDHGRLLLIDHINLRGQSEGGLGTQRLRVDACGPGHGPGHVWAKVTRAENHLEPQACCLLGDPWAWG